MNSQEYQILLKLFQQLTYIDNISGTLSALQRSIWQNIPLQTDQNGFFGQIQGPFEINKDIMTLIKEQCNAAEGANDEIYISKIGIYYPNIIKHNPFSPILSLNEKEIIIGNVKNLELEDVYITSIKALQKLDNTFFIDYQYQKK